MCGLVCVGCPVTWLIHTWDMTLSYMGHWEMCGLLWASCLSFGILHTHRDDWWDMLKQQGTYECGILHIYVRRFVAFTIWSMGGYGKYEWVMAHIWKRYTHSPVKIPTHNHRNESCGGCEWWSGIYEWVMAHIWVRHAITCWLVDPYS